MKKIVVTNDDIVELTEVLLFKLGVALSDGVINSQIELMSGSLKINLDITESRKCLKLISSSENAKAHQPPLQ